MIEVTRKYARTYVAATKKVKGAMLDEFCLVTGLSRERARHLLTATGTPALGQDPPSPRRAEEVLHGRRQGPAAGVGRL